MSGSKWPARLLNLRAQFNDAADTYRRADAAYCTCPDQQHAERLSAAARYMADTADAFTLAVRTHLRRIGH